MYNIVCGLFGAFLMVSGVSAAVIFAVVLFFVSVFVLVFIGEWHWRREISDPAPGGPAPS